MGDFNNAPINFSALGQIGQNINQGLQRRKLEEVFAQGFPTGPDGTPDYQGAGQKLMQAGFPQEGMKLMVAGQHAKQPVSSPYDRAHDAQMGKQDAINEATKEKDSKARDDLSGDLNDVTGAILDLDKRGALVNPDQPNTWTNVGNYLKSTPLGQQVEGMRGTPEQMDRDLVNQIAPSLINKIRMATKQGAKGLDSNVELQFYMKQVGDIKAGKLVNLAAMNRLDKAYGNGKLLDTLLANKSISQEEYDKINKYHFNLPAGVKETDLSSSASQGGQYQEGQTATNPQTGAKLIFRNGQWVPMQ